MGIAYQLFKEDSLQYISFLWSLVFYFGLTTLCPRNE